LREEFETWVKEHGPQVPIVYLKHDAYAHAWMTAQYEGWRACWKLLNGESDGCNFS